MNAVLHEYKAYFSTTYKWVNTQITDYTIG